METWTRKLNIREIGETYQTPIYVFSEKQFRENIEAYLSWLHQPRCIIYPMKANPSLEILTRLAAMGTSVDCTNEYEVYLAHIAGFRDEQIVYNTPAPNIQHMISLYQRGATIIIDSIDMLKTFSQLSQQGDYPGKLFIRVNPKQEMHYKHSESWQEKTAHANNTSKFGVPEEELMSLLQRYPIPLQGLHIHVGTQMDHTETFVTAVKLLNELANEINSKLHYHVHHIDLGGGLGIPFTNEGHYPTIKELGEALSPHFQNGFEYAVEPGHSLVGNTISLITRIVAIKTMRGKTWAICDVGSDQLIKVTFLNWPHQILHEDHTPLPTNGPDAVGGPLCFSGDTLLPATKLEGMQVGDYLLIQHCGAYCYALSNHFNGRLFRGMLTLQEDNNLHIADEPEDEDLTSAITFHHWGDSDYVNHMLIDHSLGKNRVTEGMPIDMKKIERLDSSYLSVQEHKDEFKITQVKKINEYTYEFIFLVHSEVDFVSMPFLIRIVGDAAIISSLLLAQQEIKDIPIWSDHLLLTLQKQVASNRNDLHCLIQMSPAFDYKSSKTKMIHIKFTVDEGLCTGSFRFKFTLK